MRRILLLSYDFPPRGATGVLRVTKFARYLPEFGWQPVVVTAAGEGVVRDRALVRQLPPDLEVIRVADPLSALRRGAWSPRQIYAAPAADQQGMQPARSKLTALRQATRRMVMPDPQIFWLPGAVRAASARLRRGDIAAVLTTSPPHSVQLGGLWLQRRFPDLVWCMDMRDLWSESSTIRDPLAYTVNRMLEFACVRAADRVIVVTNTMRDLLHREAIVPAERIVTITNGYDANDLPAIDLPLIDSSPQHDTLQIVYVGTLTSNRAPSVHGLFAALMRLAEAGIGNQTLVVRCYGLYDEPVRQWAAPLVERGMVELHPFVPHAEAVAATAAADVLLVVTSDDREGRIAIPNKLYEYLAVGKPVLALTPPGDVSRLVQTHGVGVAVPPSDVDAIVRALEQLIVQYRAGTLRRLAPNDPRIQRFERRELTRRLAALLDEAVA